ncbi:CoA ester lyase [Rhodobacteraceae bacterium D3-12]|nr:CoA ester lyase [Rhodobacteraceae bacterium D3-12]
MGQAIGKTASRQAYDFPLFVPGDKPERFAKALAAAHDAVIIDLEDAVASNQKGGARDAIADHAAVIARAEQAVFIRINARDTPWHENDLALCAEIPIVGVVLPKVESGDDLSALAAGLRGDALSIALVETAAGLLALQEIAAEADRLVFGSIDFCADVGCAHERLALLRPRQDMVIASRIAGLPAPIDGVTTALRDDEAIKSDAAHAAKLGFGGKLVIHPAQISPARAGFAPSDQDVAWAHKVLTASGGRRLLLMAQ